MQQAMEEGKGKGRGEGEGLIERRIRKKKGNEDHAQRRRYTSPIALLSLFFFDWFVSPSSKHVIKMAATSPRRARGGHTIFLMVC